MSLDVKDVEWNDYVVGYVISFLDGRSINVQFEFIQSNHPQPKLIAVIGAIGDETYAQFSELERERITTYIGNNEEIRDAENLLTEAHYGGFSLLSPCNICDVREFVEGNAV